MNTGERPVYRYTIKSKYNTEYTVDGYSEREADDALIISTIDDEDKSYPKTEFVSWKKEEIPSDGPPPVFFQ